MMQGIVEMLGQITKPQPEPCDVIKHKNPARGDEHWYKNKRGTVAYHCKKAGANVSSVRGHLYRNKWTLTKAIEKTLETQAKKLKE